MRYYGRFDAKTTLKTVVVAATVLITGYVCGVYITNADLITANVPLTVAFYAAAIIGIRKIVR